MSNRAKNRLGIILVAFGNQGTIKALLDNLSEEKKPEDRIVVVDNHPDHKTAEIAEQHKAVDTVIRSDNVGFGGGCNLGAEQLEGLADTIFFLNPDTLAKPGLLNIIRSAPDSDWAAWMPLLVTPDGKVNTAGNILHISGLSWISHFGEPASNFTQPKEVDLLSGACLAIDAKAWRHIGGFADNYFMYYEDTDLCLRLKLAGYKLGLNPAAQVVHDYSYKKGRYKFFCLERNRYLLIIRTWPLAVIAALLPILVVSEIGLWGVSILERRFLLKVHSSLSLIKILPAALADRHRIQKQRRLSSAQFLGLLSPEINTPLLGKLGRSKFLNRIFSLYFKLAKKLVGA